jgi:hypothetical protein
MNKSCPKRQISPLRPRKFITSETSASKLNSNTCNRSSVVVFHVDFRSLYITVLFAAFFADFTLFFRPAKRGVKRCFNNSINCTTSMVKDTGKSFFCTCHGSVQGDQRCSSSLPVTSATSRPLYASQVPHCPVNPRLGGTQSRYGPCEGQKNLLPLLGFKLRTAHPVALVLCF